MKLRLDVPVAVDGDVELATDLYLPDGEGPWPVALCRTPYDRQDAEYVDWAVRFVDGGYAAVLQDCRGRYASGGRWEAYVHEERDGATTVDWLAAQDFCDGRVGMFGISYVGFVQSLAATQAPAGLRAIVPTASQEDNFGHMWLDGVLQLENVVNFAFYVGRRTMHAGSARHYDLASVYRTLPLADALDGIVPADGYRSFLAHPTFDDFWSRYSLKGRYDRIHAPALLITGWYDNLLAEQFKVLEGLRSQGGSPLVREHSRMVIGPWSHFGLGGRHCADIDFGPDAERDLPALHLDHYDRFLRRARAAAPEATFEFFVMGENTWRRSATWPPPECEALAYFLASDGSARSAAGDGRLETESSGGPPDRFVYNPLDPVPTVGGPCMLERNTGPRDRASVAERGDVLVYQTPPIAQALEVTGPVAVALWAASDAPTTDFTATLVDAGPDGSARTVCEGIARVGALVEPTPIDISLWSTSWVFLPGHRIRLEVTSSNFPRFDRNLNSGEAPMNATHPQCANQTVYHDEVRPSALLLWATARPDLG